MRCEDGRGAWLSVMAPAGCFPWSGLSSLKPVKVCASQVPGQNPTPGLFLCFLIVMPETLSLTYTRLNARDYMTRDRFFKRSLLIQEKIRI